jgi:hypothetical protein
VRNEGKRLCGDVVKRRRRRLEPYDIKMGWLEGSMVERQKNAVRRSESHEESLV